MPHNDRHTSQKKKNIALMLVLLVLIALIYGITVMKMKGG
jgi:hypothetical protein